MTQENKLVSDILASDNGAVLADWLAEVRASVGSATVTQTLSADAQSLLHALRQALLADADVAQLDKPVWMPVRDALEQVSGSGAAQGVTAGQTSAFILALKKPLFMAVQARLASDPSALIAAIWSISTLVDRLAQFTLTIYQKSREEIISRQQQELLELSTPVVKLWDGVLAVPMIGTLDSSRTQLVMESLLQRIVDTGSELAIIDITGVPTVDTLVAQHLLKTVTAIRLMGADCIISGVRPQIAQTIVHLGIDLQGITTKASLADALALALKKGGYVVTKPKG